MMNAKCKDKQTTVHLTYTAGSNRCKRSFKLTSQDLKLNIDIASFSCRGTNVLVTWIFRITRRFVETLTKSLYYVVDDLQPLLWESSVAKKKAVRMVMEKTQRGQSISRPGEVICPRPRSFFRVKKMSYEKKTYIYSYLNVWINSI